MCFENAMCDEVQTTDVTCWRVTALLNSECSQTLSEVVFRNMLSVRMCHLSSFTHEAAKMIANEGKNPIHSNGKLSVVCDTVMLVLCQNTLVFE